MQFYFNPRASWQKGVVQIGVTNESAKQGQLSFSELSVSPKLVVLTTHPFHGGNRRVPFYSLAAHFAAPWGAASHSQRMHGQSSAAQPAAKPRTSSSRWGAIDHRARGRIRRQPQ